MKSPDAEAAPRLRAVPPLRWAGTPATASVDGGVLHLTSAPGVDWSNDAITGDVVDDAAALVFAPPVGDFTLSAEVSVLSQRTTFDAGALALFRDSSHWAKLCFERAPDTTLMVVSVVTDGFSDDVNSTTVHGDGVHLRLARVGRAVLFHSSTDGRRWDFVRQFRPPWDGGFDVGFLAQSPVGPGCHATFDHIRLESVSLRGHERDGT